MNENVQQINTILSRLATTQTHSPTTSTVQSTVHPPLGAAFKGVGSVASGPPPHAAGNRETMAHNHHPTVKPTALMRWLCRLVTPPGGIVLDPFAGSGSTGKAAVLEGFGFVGIEREPEYFEIMRRRIEHAQAQMQGRLL